MRRGRECVRLAPVEVPIHHTTPGPIDRVSVSSMIVARVVDAGVGDAAVDGALVRDTKASIVTATHNGSVKFELLRHALSWRECQAKFRGSGESIWEAAVWSFIGTIFNQ